MTYTIAEWYGHDFVALAPIERQQLADSAVDGDQRPCPYKGGMCSKAGGVCSIREYAQDGDRVALPAAAPLVVTCPNRFEQDGLLIRWLAELTSLGGDVMVARQVPIMLSRNGRDAGKIDLVVATENGELRWFGLEVQSVYFSGGNMGQEFEQLRADTGTAPPFPKGTRHPDWRSSTAKRLMPQLAAKVPTLARWGARMAVAVDTVLFDDAMGGPSPEPNRDIDSGDVIWLVTSVEAGRLHLAHWEVLPLRESTDRLLAAEPVSRADFELRLRGLLRPVEMGEQQ